MSVCGGVVRYSNRKAIKCGRHEAVAANKIDQLGDASLAKEGESLSISGLRKDAAIDQSRRNIIAGCLLFS